jgi:hypothetical protein
MPLKQFYLTFVFINLLTYNVLSQSKDAWVLPKYQFNVQLGTSNFRDYIGADKADSNIPFIGLSYTYNVSLHWYAHFNWQLMRTQFIMGENIFTDNGFRRMVASSSSPLSLPIIELKAQEDRQSFIAEIKNAPLINLTSPKGFYQRNQFNFNTGYMKVLPRNILRIGLGISYFRTQSRAMQSISVVPIDENTFGYGANIPHLALKNISNINFNGLISYDFFITQKASIGAYLGALINKNSVRQTTQLGLTFGYAPHLSIFNKNKLKPKV